ncbi:MAG: hypothetical protein Q8R44_10585 [Novosphingobium sp.]|nr:hypothetical protein [Novosphingobium sp.]
MGLGEDFGLLVVAREHEIGADLPAIVRGKSGGADSVSDTIKPAQRESQVLVDRPRNVRVGAIEIVVGILKLGSAFEFLATGPGDVIDGRAQAIGVKNAAGAALDHLDPFGHQIGSHGDIVVHELNFGFLEPRQSIEQLRGIAITAGDRQAAHGDVVACLAGSRSLGENAGHVLQQIGGADRSQLLDVGLVEGINRIGGIDLAYFADGSGDDDFVLLVRVRRVACFLSQGRTCEQGRRHNRK